MLKRAYKCYINIHNIKYYMKVIVSYTIDNKIKSKLDKIRGDIPRSKFIGRLIESYVVNNESETISKEKNKPENINPPEDTSQVEQ